MNQRLRKPIDPEYPEWQNKPQQLSNTELANPYTVLDEFFQMFSLREARIQLNQMLEDALSVEDVYPMSHLNLHDYLEKLTEAAFVLHEQNKTNSNIVASKAHQENTAATNESNTGIQLAGEKKEVRFSKGRLLLERVTENPSASLAQIFSIIEPEDFANALHTWLNVALSNDRSMYEEGAQRADLIQFIEKLHHLIEALYLISAVLKVHPDIKVEEDLPQSFLKEILKKTAIRLLSPEQISRPQLVLNDFFKLFTITYARTELWDLLDALISYQGRQFLLDRFNLLLYYDSVVCLVEAACLIHEQIKDRETTNNSSSDSTQTPENSQPS